jgi:uncharacterized protein YoxC
MLDTSQDLLYIVLSLSVLWFTIFLCWLLYQAARVLKNANNIIENLTEKLELIVDAVDFIKEKIENLSSTMGIMNGVVGGLAEKFIFGKVAKSVEDKMCPKKKTSRRKKRTTRK